MVTITQEPNKNNSAYVPNVWILNSIGVADRYVLRVLIDNVPVATFKQPRNAANVGIFDIQKVLQSYLQPTFIETTPKVADTPFAHLTYRIEYGSETGNSTTIDGISDLKYVINMYDNWDVVNSDLENYIPKMIAGSCETAVDFVAAYPMKGLYKFLTNFPEQYDVLEDEYKTLSFYSRIENWNDGNNWGPNEAMHWVTIKFYNDALFVAETVYAISAANGSSIRGNCNDLVVNSTDSNIITTVGVGPQNLKDANLWIGGNYNRYVVTIHTKDSCKVGSIGDCEDVGEILDDGWVQWGIYEAAFNLKDDCPTFEPITVSFLNQFGVKDYYTFDKRNTRTTNTQRNSYTKTLGTCNDTTFTIDAHGRGKTTFASTAQTEMTLQTDWMSDEVSKWLQELFQSPSTQIYTEGTWIPCNITTATYEQKTNSRNKLFQHEITVEFSNNQKIQRG